MQCCQAPVNAVQAEMLRQPVLKLVFPLSADERKQDAKKRIANLVKTLNIFDVFVYEQLQILWNAGAR